MSKKCAKCEKTVYPTEEFRCLDKTWHKGCFKCWECGMTLGMKTYKGYDKKPYCNAHYPKLGFTAAADTPEMARLAQNTKIQSQVAYHSDFEKDRGKHTSVADDPETLRILKSQQNVSLVKYHEEFEKNIKGTKVSVTDEPELNRLKKNQALTSQIEYTGAKMKNAEMEARREMGQGEVPRQPPPVRQTSTDSPYSGKQTGHSTAYSAQGKVEQTSGRGKVGSIADYDPMSENWGSLGGGYQPSNAASGRQEWEETYPAAQQQQQQQQPQEPAQPQYYPPPQQQQPPPPAQPPAPKGPVYKAMYDYEAQDDDEVGFQDGDAIVDIEVIDEGWMFGTVQRTGKRGMLPANYVEKC